MHRESDMAGTTRESELLDEIVYARVLLSLKVEELKRRDRALRERLRSLLQGLGAEEGRRLCEAALERAWQRVADEVEGEGRSDQTEPASAPR